MGIRQSTLSAAEVAACTQVSVEEAEELLAAFMKHNGGAPIGIEGFKKVLGEVQHLYDSPALSPQAADLYFQIFDTAHDGLIDPLEFVAGCSIVATGSMEQRAELVFKAIDRNQKDNITRDDLAIWIDNMLGVGEKLFSQKILPVVPVRLGAAHEYKTRFKQMKHSIREDMLTHTFAVGSGGKISRSEWLAAAKANNDAVMVFLQPYEPLEEIVNAAIVQIHRELDGQNSSPTTPEDTNT